MQPARDFRTIDWETSPKSVAFHPPHFLLFSWNFIEVRHIHTGKLVQIISQSPRPTSRTSSYMS